MTKVQFAIAAMISGLIAFLSSIHIGTPFADDNGLNLLFWIGAIVFWVITAVCGYMGLKKK